MLAAASSRPTPISSTSEWGAALALPPLLATAGFYTLPLTWQHDVRLQFLPQIASYAGLLLWALGNDRIVQRLGLEQKKLRAGTTWGLLIGLILGSLNTLVILRVVPWLGHDISFLRQTPHAQIPIALLVPWTIILIAVFVEVNFRGFLLGRLLALSRQYSAAEHRWFPPTVAIGTSSVTFAFDPFMVATFQHLHWIALWDGLIWGSLWLRLRNLYAPIMAHAVEVIIMYGAVRTALG